MSGMECVVTDIGSECVKAIERKAVVCGRY